MTTLERGTMLGPFPLPPIDSPAVRERARKLAGTGRRWLAFEDPAAPTDKPLPKGAIQGGYEVTETGELTGRYQINPHYRPSEQVARMPLNTVEVVLWRALHGYNPAGLLADTLYRAELAVYAAHDGDQQLHVARNGQGQAVLTAFTSARHLPDDWAHHHRLPGWAIVDAMREQPVFLDLNPATPLALKILVRDVALLLTERSVQSRALGPITLDRQD